MKPTTTSSSSSSSIDSSVNHARYPIHQRSGEKLRDVVEEAKNKYRNEGKRKGVNGMRDELVKAKTD
jgi:hypothetical protein